MKFLRTVLESDQGAHALEKSGKTGNFVKKIPCWEKSGNLEKWVKSGKNQGILQKHVREKSGNFTKTCQGNIGEFSALYIMIVSPFSRIYISLGST